MIWVAVFCCLLVSFVFSGIEAGILSMNRVRLQHRVKMGDAAAIQLRQLLVNPERFLVTVLVVTNLMNIVAIMLASQSLVGWMGWRGYGVTLALFLPLNLFLLEVLPKSLFRRFPYRALSTLAAPLRFADLLLTPMHWVGWRVTGFIFGRRPAAQRKLFLAREDFKYLTAESEQRGALTPLERKMIHNVIDFRAVVARQVMVPIAQVQTIPAQATVAELLARSLETGFQRWPVRDENGAITGLVDAFGVALEAKREGPVSPHQRRLLRVLPNERAYAVLRKLRAARLTLALVEEAGAPLGIVTAEDLIRRLVDTAARGEGKSA